MRLNIKILKDEKDAEDNCSLTVVFIIFSPWLLFFPPCPGSMTVCSFNAMPWATTSFMPILRLVYRVQMFYYDDFLLSIAAFIRSPTRCLHCGRSTNCRFSSASMNSRLWLCWISVRIHSFIINQGFWNNGRSRLQICGHRPSLRTLFNVRYLTVRLW